MKIAYIAYDGKIFYDEVECMAHDLGVECVDDCLEMMIELEAEYSDVLKYTDSKTVVKLKSLIKELVDGARVAQWLSKNDKVHR